MNSDSVEPQDVLRAAAKLQESLPSLDRSVAAGLTVEALNERNRRQPGRVSPAKARQAAEPCAS